MSPRTPVAGIAYALWLQGRLGVLASVVATLALAAIAATAAPIPRILVSGATGLAFGSGMAYLVLVVTYGSADISTPESGYPRHAFVFPVRARALVGVPMFCGSVAAAVLWATLAPLAFAGLGQPVPRLWPAATVAAVIAWLQAISWSPYRWSFVRVFLAIVVLAVFVIGGIAAQEYRVGDWTIAGLTLMAGALAYPVTVRTLSRARRGDGAEPFALPSRAGTSARSRSPLPSPARAQLWLELRRNAWLVPLLTAGCALLLGSILAFTKQGHPNVLLPTSVPPGAGPVLLLLGLPVFMAMVNSGGLGKFDLWTKGLTFPTFLLARPISTAAIVGAKLRSAAIAAAWGWASVLIVLGMYVWIPGTYAPQQCWATFLTAHATPRSVAAACLVIILLIVWTWRMAVQSLWIPLLGRQWVVVVLPTVQILATGALGWAGYRAYTDPHLHALVWPWLRPALAGLAVVKLAAAATVFAVIRRHALMTPAGITRVACIWAALVLSLCAAMILAFPTARGSLAMLAPMTILFLPLVRPAFAILALRDNRHR